MSSKVREIRDLIRSIAGTTNNVNVFICDAVVRSVDEGSRTCIVDSADDNKDIDGTVVRLMPTIADGELNIPEEKEIISVMFSNFFEPLMIQFSWLTKKKIIIGNQGYEIIDGKQTFNDGKYGGIPRVINPDDEDASLLARLNDQEEKYNNLVEQFNTLRADFNSHVTTYNSHIHPFAGTIVIGALTCSGTTSPTANTGTPTTATDGEDIDITTEEQISNPNIIHGDKLED